MKTTYLTLFFAAMLFATSCDTSTHPAVVQAERQEIVLDTTFASPLDSLEYLVNNIDMSVNERLKILENLSFDLSDRSFEKSIYYANLGLDLSLKEKNDSLTGSFYRNKGIVYTYKQAYDTAIIYFDKALYYAIKTKYENLESFLYVAYGKMYSDRKELNTAIEYYDKGLRLSEKNGYYGRLTTIAYNSATIFYNLKNYEQAEKYLLKAIEINNTKVKKPFYSVLSGIYILYSMICTEQEKEEEAIDFIQKSLDYAQLANSLMDEANALLAGALIYNELFNDYEKALEMVNRAFEISNELDYDRLKTECLQSFAQYYGKKGDYSKAKTFLFQALELATVDIGRKRNMYHDLLYFSIRSKETDDALISLSTYDSLTIALNSQEVQIAISDLEIRYETEKKEIEIERQQQVISRQNLQRILLTVGIAVCIVILAMLWYMLRMRNRRNRVLAEINITKDKFFNIISHDLKNPAISQRDTLNVLVRNASAWDADTLADYHSELLKSADGQVELIMNLLGWSKLQTGRMICSPETFILSDLLPNLSLIRKMAENKHISLTIQIPENKLITADSNILATVIRNLTTNAIKFTPSGGQVTLSVEPTAGKTYFFTVSDTGTGMTKEQIRDLFRLDSVHSQRGTAGEQGSGLGLIVCRELLEKHGSTLHVESEEGKGSRFWFEV